MVWRDPDERLFYIWRFMVDAGFQGKGVGRRALELLLDEARGDGVDEVTLSVVPGPTSAMAFYERCGFEATGEMHGGEAEMKLTLSSSRELVCVRGRGSSCFAPTLIGRCRPSPQPNCGRARPPRPLEVVWQDDATAIVLARGADGLLSAGDLRTGMPAIADLPLAGRGIAARRLDPAQLVSLAAAPPAGLELGASARAVFAVVELARRSVAEGLVHPSSITARAGGTRSGAPRSTRVSRARSTAIAAALPAVGAGAFDGDRDATVNDLYRCWSTRSRATASAPQGAARRRRRPVRANAIDHLLEGLTVARLGAPPPSGLGALERRLSEWVDAGLETRTRTEWRLGLHLDERPAVGPGDEPRLVLELWLQASDDPRSDCPRRCSGTATTTSSRSCVPGPAP